MERNLENLVLTKEQILKSIKEVNSKKPDVSNTADEDDTSRYARTLTAASHAAVQGGDRVIGLMKLVRKHAEDKGASGPIYDRFVQNLQKFERSHSKLVKKVESNDRHLITNSEAEEAVRDIIIERSKYTILPSENFVSDKTDSNIELEEWGKGYEDISKIIETIVVRNGDVIKFYDPHKHYDVTVKIDSYTTINHLLYNLPHVGLFIQDEAFEWLRDYKLDRYLENVLGIVVFTKW